MTIKIEYAKWDSQLGQTSDVRTAEVLEQSALGAARELCRDGFAVTGISAAGPSVVESGRYVPADSETLHRLEAMAWALVRHEGLDVDQQRQMLLVVADRVEARMHAAAADDEVDNGVEAEQERMVREVAEQVERCQRNGCHLSMDACAKTFEDDWLERNKL